MNLYWGLTLFTLFFNATVCLIAVFAKVFDDNLLQRIGLALLSISLYGRVWTLWQEGMIEPQRAWIHYGMFFFAIGTALKFYLRWKDDKVFDFVWHRRVDDEENSFFVHDRATNTSSRAKG